MTTPVPTQSWFTIVADGFGAADSFVRGIFEWGGAWVAILLFLAAIGFLFRDFGRCYHLLRKTRDGRLDAGGRRDVVLTILKIALKDGTLFAVKQRKLIRRVRMRVEHEMFPPTPQVDVSRFKTTTSPRKVEKIIQEIDDAEPGARRYKAYLRARAKWAAGLSRIHEPQHNTIRVENAAEVNAHFSEMDRYFDLLTKLKIEPDSKHFICPIEIRQGFISPLHLLTGLLIEFNQKWGNVLTAFNRDAGLPSDALGEFGGDLREIQMFIYTCWLLWGPSIPVCGCDRSDARFRTIQYGFGDENNSLEVVGAASLVDPAMAELLATGQRRLLAALEPGQRAAFSMPMALPAMVRGRLRLSNTIGLDERDTDAMPKTSTTIWKGGLDPRPVLYLSTIDMGDATAGAPTYQSVQIGQMSAAQETVRSRYYSAYLWIAFVMMEESADGAFIPLSELKGGSSRPWTDIVPFFEHGNLADPQSCQYGKDQLAAKVAEALAQLFRRLPTDTRTRFVFACSIDDAGCGAGTVFPGWQGGKPIRDRVRDKIAAEAERGHADYVALRASGIVIFEPQGAAWRAAHDYSACALPELVDDHYKDMDAKADQAG